MGVNEAISAQIGVVKYLNKIESKIDIGKPKNKTYRQQDIHLNNLLMEFGKDNSIKMLKNNSFKYKGTFSPFMENCKAVQENWNLFKIWIIDKYGVLR